MPIEFFPIFVMMRVSNYISDLLYRYECVTVPGFGAFLAHHKPAQVHHTIHAFYPPSKVLSFNAQLISNDGLLAKYMADVEDISYEKALSKIERYVANWKTTLEKKETLILKDIGELWLNEALKIQFKPTHAVNYLASSFGLHSFVSNAVEREILKKEVVEMETAVPIFFTPEQRTKKSYLKYAAIALVLLSIGSFLGVKHFRNRYQENIQYAEKEAQKQVEENIQQATFFDAAPIELPSIAINAQKETNQNANYHVIAGAFRIERNAEKRMRQLTAKGYTPKRLGINKYGLHIVAYTSFRDADEALSFLRDARRNEAWDAWLYVAE
ncbi:SPOR domain-containing protein [Leptobacterium sp. I13]|uniref:HU domain-containing protein n=1 Tax=Leptobacterium meishanense TaxID=3128904 RepID=UPI0030EBC23B